MGEMADLHFDQGLEECDECGKLQIDCECGDQGECWYCGEEDCDCGGFK